MQLKLIFQASLYLPMTGVSIGPLDLLSVSPLNWNVQSVAIQLHRSRGFEMDAKYMKTVITWFSRMEKCLWFVDCRTVTLATMSVKFTTASEKHSKEHSPSVRRTFNKYLFFENNIYSMCKLYKLKHHLRPLEYSLSAWRIWLLYKTAMSHFHIVFQTYSRCDLIQCQDTWKYISTTMTTLNIILKG